MAEFCATKNIFSPALSTTLQLNVVVEYAGINMFDIKQLPAVAVTPIAALTEYVVDDVLQNNICFTITVDPVGARYLPEDVSVSDVTAATGP